MSILGTGLANLPTWKQVLRVSGCAVFLLMGLTKSLTAQNSTPFFQEPTRIISNLPAYPSDMDVDQEGNIYLISNRKHQISKIFQGKRDSLLTIGGKGMGQEGFNTPTKVCVQNRQNTFMLDFMNRRILLFNTNLKITSELNFMEFGRDFNSDFRQDIFPETFTSGPSGEIFILNQNDYKIYKFNIFGELELDFMGMDYGDGRVENPVEIASNDQNYIFISDTTSQIVKVFDLYGIYQYTLYPEADFRWQKMEVLGNFLILFDEQNIFVKNLFSKKYSETKLESASPILDVSATQDYFYVLFKNQINLYPLKTKK